ncbi:MAG: ribosome silencing factor [Bryobacteraceae bacterium]
MTRKKDSLRPELHVAIKAAQDKQAAEITLLDLQGLGAFTDQFIVCSGFSSRQVDAICDEIEEQLRRIGVRLLHREGKAGAEWMLLDFGSFLVHVFTERARHYYDIERLWRAARRINFNEAGEPEAVIRMESAPDVAEAEG